MRRFCSWRMRAGIALVGLIAGVILPARPPAGADPQQTRRAQRTGDVLLSSYERFDDQPAAAFNDESDEYLVVWCMGGRIVGQRVGYAGLPEGDVFDIGVADGHRKYAPAVAWSPRARQFLVVWEEVHSDYDIEGQLIGADGARIDNPYTPEDESRPDQTFAVYDGPGDQREPDLDFDGASFYVAWTGPRSGDSRDVHSRFVQDNGEVLAGLIRVAECADGGCRSPAVAYSAASNDYLVAYESGTDDAASVLAVRVHPSGSVVGVPHVLCDRADCHAPDAIGLADGSYLVALDADPAGTGSDIFGHLLMPDDTIEPVEIALAPGYQYRPRLDRARASDVALAVWTDGRNVGASASDIYGVRLQAGRPLGEPLAIAEAPRSDGTAAVAAAQGPEAFLVTWIGGRDEEQDVFGQVVGMTGALVGGELALSAAPGDQRAPALAYDADDDQYLSLWVDESTGGVMARRLDGDGAPLEIPWSIDAEGVNADPTVLYHTGRKHYLALWSDSAEAALEGAVIYPGGPAVAPFRVALGPAAHPAVARAPGEDDRVLVAYQRDGDIHVAALYGDGNVTRQGLRTLAEGPGTKGHAALAADDARGRTLVVWEASRAGGTNEIRGRFVAPNGASDGDELCLAGCQDAYDHIAPALAHDATRAEYLLLHARSETPTETRVRGQRFSPDAASVGAEFDLDAAPSERHAPLRCEPVLVFDRLLGSYLAAWPAWGVDGARMDLYWRLLAPPPGTSTPARLLIHMPGEQIEPAAAPGTAPGEYLLAWNDGRREGSSDVYARSVAADITPPEARLAAEPSVAPVGTSFTFDAQASEDDHTPRALLAVRWDWSSDGAWDTTWSTTKIVSRTIDAAGLYTVTVQVADLSANTAVARRPVLVLEPGTNRPPTARLTATPDRAPAGAEFVFDAGGSSDRETPAGELALRWDWGDDGRWDTDWGRETVVSRTLVQAGAYRARVEVRDGGGLTDAAAALVAVEPGDLARLVVQPSLAVLAPGRAQRFQATGTDAHDNEVVNPAVAWRVLDPSVGRIDGRGVFTAAMRSGTFREVVRAAGGAVEASASVTILWAERLFVPLAQSPPVR